MSYNNFCSYCKCVNCEGDCSIDKSFVSEAWRKTFEKKPKIKSETEKLKDTIIKQNEIIKELLEKNKQLEKDAKLYKRIAKIVYNNETDD